MSENEPLIPNLGEMPASETGDDVIDNEVNQQADLSDNPSNEEQIPNKDKETLEEEERTKATNSMLSGWKDDRKRLSTTEKENQEMRTKLARYEEKDEDFLGLSEDERVDKMVERREADTKAKHEKEEQEVESEIRWHKAKDPFFGTNEKRIMANASGFNCKSLKDAIKITKQQDKLVKDAKGTSKYKDNQQKNADGVGGSKAGGKHTSSYNAKVDKNKSISQLYQEGGI